MVEENSGHFEARIHHRHVHGACAIGRSDVRVRAVREQHFHRVLMTIADREQQRRKSSFRFRLHVRAELNQHRGGCSVAFRSGPHEGRLPANWLGQVHFCAVRQQQMNGFHVSGERGVHQRSLPLLGDLIRVCAAFQQARDHRCIAVVAREGERSDVVPVRRIGVRAAG